MLKYCKRSKVFPLWACAKKYCAGYGIVQRINSIMYLSNIIPECRVCNEKMMAVGKSTGTRIKELSGWLGGPDKYIKELKYGEFGFLSCNDFTTIRNKLGVRTYYKCWRTISILRRVYGEGSGILTRLAVLVRVGGSFYVSTELAPHNENITGEYQEEHEDLSRHDLFQVFTIPKNTLFGQSIDWLIKECIEPTYQSSLFSKNIY